MLAHKLNHPIAGTVLGAAMIVAIAFVVSHKSANAPLGIKSDRLERRGSIGPAEDGGCAQAAWPYGCGWQLPPEKHDTKRHFPSGGKPQRRGLFKFLS